MTTSQAGAATEVAATAGPGVGRPLSPTQVFALFARMLCRIGYDDGLAGHITVHQPDNTYLTNPFAIAWDQLRASEVAVCDADGRQLSGPYEINPAVSLHFALHRRRKAEVIVHNHPRWATTWAAHRRLPPVYDQSSGLASGNLVLVKEYTGTVEQDQAAQEVLTAMGDAEVALLANHGVLITADSVEMALTRARVLEIRSRNAWQVESMGSGGQELPPEMVQRLSDGIARFGGAFRGYYASMVRREIAADPSVLD